MSASAKPVLGYVGVGLMGGPMVARLASRGWAIRAYEVVPERLAAAVAAGARPAVSPADAARGAGLVLLNLPTTDAVEQAMFGEDGVASGIAPPARVVDFSTVEVERGRGFAARLRERTGCGWVDAPVSGGPPASAAGTLPGVRQLAARRRRRDGRRCALGRDRDGSPRLRVARPDRADHRSVQHALRLPRRRALDARDRPAHLGGAAADQCRPGRQGEHPDRRQRVPGRAPAHLEGEGAVAEGHAGKEVPRRAGQALVLDDHRHGRDRDAGRGVRARDRARDRAGRRPGEPAAEPSSASSSSRCRSS